MRCPVKHAVNPKPKKAGVPASGVTVGEVFWTPCLLFPGVGGGYRRRTGF